MSSSTYHYRIARFIYSNRFFFFFCILVEVVICLSGWRCLTCGSGHDNEQSDSSKNFMLKSNGEDARNTCQYVSIVGMKGFFFFLPLVFAPFNFRQLDEMRREDEARVAAMAGEQQLRLEVCSLFVVICCFVYWYVCMK